MAVASQTHDVSIRPRRFRISGLLGRGNMCEVYLAVDESVRRDAPDRSVAVRVIRRTRTGTAVSVSEAAKVAVRFAREVRIMRRLRYPLSWLLHERPATGCA